MADYIPVTILSPAYNKGKTIRRTFESLLHQTNYQFEWVIVNDGSTDDTQDIFSTFHTRKKLLVTLITEFSVLLKMSTLLPRRCNISSCIPKRGCTYSVMPQNARKCLQPRESSTGGITICKKL